MNRRYQKGRRAEYKTAKLLEADGYLVQRSAGSHKWDLTAFRGIEPVKVIEVKCNIGEAAAMREVKRLRKLFHIWAPVDIECYVWHDHVADPYIYP